MAAKQDQVIWTIFGVFWAANAVLLVALFSSGELPSADVGLLICSCGVGLSVVWLLIQQRAIAWIVYYEKVIERLEGEHLQVPSDVALSSNLNKALGGSVGGRRVRPLMENSPLIVVLLWIASAAIAAIALTRA
jgi:hypothetical protein